MAKQRVQDMKTPIGKKYMYMKKMHKDNPENAVVQCFYKNFD